MTDTHFSGGCQCGAIRFRTAELIDNARICHCRMCQKAAGNYFAALVSAPKETLVWTRGTPARFRSSADVDRGFCAQCGTPLFYDNIHWDDIGLMIGALDDPAAVKPLTQDSTESRMPWFRELVLVPDKGTSEEIDGPNRAAEVRSSNRQHPDHDTEKWR